ncbi:MAG: tetratricopeptide repeat protein [Treponema sp.]|nr:tetratricopeptide repeat protein [Treponema sp.]
MKKLMIVLAVALSVTVLSGCKNSGKDILKKRIEKMEKSSGNPISIEEIEESIDKYYKDVEEIAEKNSQIGIWYKILGTRYLDNKMYGKALECFQKALTYYPDNPNLYYYVGLCSCYVGNAAIDARAYDDMQDYYALAEKAYLRALAIDDRYGYALYGISTLYTFQLGRPEDAIPYLKKQLSIDTKNIDAMTLLANAYYLTGQFDLSVDMFDEIIVTTKSDKTKAAAEESKKKVLERAYQ